MTEGPEALRRLRGEVRDLLRNWRAAGTFTPRCDGWLRGHDPELTKALAARRWIGMTWPEHLGGGARSNVARLVVTEELLRFGAPVAAHWVADRQIGPAILRYGSADLQGTFLPRIAAGEVTFCLGMSETEAGSDLAAVRTSAVRDGDGWRVTGRKIWTSQAHRSTHAYVLARTAHGERKHEGLTELVLDLSANGVTVRPILDMAGEHHFNEMVFDDVYVPGHHVIGAVGNGWAQVTEQLSFERGGPERFLSTYPLLARLVETARPTDPVAASTVGELLARLVSLRRMAYDIAVALDRGEAPSRQAAMLKLLGTAFERDITEAARVVLGDEPDIQGGESARLLAEGILAAPGFSIRGGTSEMLATIIARSEVGTVTRSAGDSEIVRQVADEVLSEAGSHADADGLDPVWPRLCELGWPVIGIAEERAGSGGSLRDLVAVLTAVGAHATAVPLAETALATWVLAEAGHTDRLRDANVVRTIAFPQPSDRLEVRGENGTRLTGAVGRVPWAMGAADILVAVDDGLLLIDRFAAGLAVVPGRNLAGEPRETISAADVSAMVLAGTPPVSDVETRASLLRGAQVLGALEEAIRSTREHVRAREQFGRSLASFQLVSSSVATMVSQMAAAQAAVEAALFAVEHGRPSRHAYTAAARVVLGRAATEVARLAHQLHGAMGVTREHGLHRTTRRLWSWRDEWGAQHRQAKCLGGHAIEAGLDELWRLVTASDEWIDTA